MKPRFLAGLMFIAAILLPAEFAQAFTRSQLEQRVKNYEDASTVDLTKREIERRIDMLQQYWFMQIYEKINGTTLSGDTDVKQLVLKVNDIRKFIIEPQRLKPLVTDTSKRMFCDLIAPKDAVKEENRKSCLKNPDDYIKKGQYRGDSKNALTTLDLIKENLESQVFQQGMTVKSTYRQEALRKVNELGDVSYKRVGELAAFSIPRVDTRLGDQSPEKPTQLLPDKPTQLSELKKAKPRKPFLSQLSKSQELSVQRSYLDTSKSAAPAAFGVTHFGGSDETQAPGSKETVGNFNSALIWKPLITLGLQDPSGTPPEFPGNQYFRSDLLVGIESQVTTNDDASTVTHFVAGEFNFSTIKGDPDAFLAGNRFITSLNYQTDRKYEANILGAAFQWTPNWGNVGLGKNIFHGKKDGFLQNVVARWRPYFELTYNDIRDVGILPNTSTGGQLNLGVRTVGLLRFYDRFSVIPELRFTKELKDNKGTHLLFSVTGALALDDAGVFSLTTTYTRGEEEPTFIEKDQLTVGLGVKF